MTIFKTASIYVLSNIINAAIPFLLLPVITKYLSQEEYGQAAMFQSLVLGLAAFVGLNIQGFSIRKYFDKNDVINTEYLANSNGACFLVLIFTTIITSIFLGIFNKEISNLLSIPSEWINIAVLTSATSFIIQLRLGQWQVRNDAIKYGLLLITQSSLYMGLSLIFIISMKLGSEGRILGQFYSTLIFSIISIGYLYKDKLLKLDNIKYSMLKEIIFYGIPLIPHTFGFFIIYTSDRIILNKYLGLSSVGIYVLAVQVSSVVTILCDSINKAYMPWLFSKLKLNNKNVNLSIVKSTYYYFLFLIFMSFLSFLIGPYIISFIAPTYIEASHIIGYLCLGQAISSMYTTISNYLFYTKNTGVISTITIISGILNAILMAIMIYYSGLFGAALAFCISKLIQLIMVWYISNKYYPMPWFIYR
ncbi:oligosaccharide flippase family protein [Proteus mirabilis]|uniref:lipopolysaccharide biosynthesis protein n=1 Tax=Proteus mirabilis TaxID=584 RepID=UPI001C2BD14F|nr:oligosaccharide flippase family protein [Proteus mirabilis]MBU9979158.1 oligosaccharide flippase family protein [Proteus mirabilis]HEK0623323.1 oligosaccharide flippase family protein [Proteus mirabilis]